MASLLLICACVGIILYRVYKYMFYKPPNFPPGPPRIPFFGSYLFLLLINYNHIHRAIDWLCKFYKTKILGFYYADKLIIVANDAVSVKEMLFNTDFDGKPPMMLAKLREPNFDLRGIFFTEGPLWKNQRRFTLRHLRDYGFGRRFDELELDTKEEILQMIDVIKNGPKYDHEKAYCKNGQVLMPQAFVTVPANSFLKVLVNERLPRKDHDKLCKVAAETISFQRTADLYGRMFSVIESLVKLLPGLSGFNGLRKNTNYMYAFMKEIVEEHFRSFDPDHERSVLDIYFREIKNAKENNEPSFFFFDQLVLTCVDFIFPPLSAIPVTIAFLMQRLILDPSVQKKIQNEIDEVVGQGRLPTLDDRINLPYTEASLREIMRFETLVPSGLVHRTLEDTQFMGYDIPKHTLAMPALQALHNDEDKWGDPHVFRPERFLDTSGRLSLKKDHSLPFGAGKRLCAGETFARNTLFLMISGLLQNFTVKAPNGNIDKVPRDSTTGLISTLPDFWATFEPR